MSKLDQIKALGAAKAASRNSSGRSDGVNPAVRKEGGADRLPRPADTPAIDLVKAVAGNAVSGAACHSVGVSKLKRGRPKIGEVRERPWETCDPPMSYRTWNRRQRAKEQK
jgi:hypothetical protein